VIELNPDVVLTIIGVVTVLWSIVLITLDAGFSGRRKPVSEDTLAAELGRLLIGFGPRLQSVRERKKALRPGQEP